MSGLNFAGNFPSRRSGALNTPPLPQAENDSLEDSTFPDLLALGIKGITEAFQKEDRILSKMIGSARAPTPPPPPHSPVSSSSEESSSSSSDESDDFFPPPSPRPSSPVFQVRYEIS